MGYYDQQAGLRNTFQLVLRGKDYAVPAGEGQLGFFWTTMGWNVAAANGVCLANALPDSCVPGLVGFGSGQAGNGFVLEGSGMNGIASVVQNKHIWFDLDRTAVVPVPASGWLLLSGIAVFGYLRGAGRRQAHS